MSSLFCWLDIFAKTTVFHPRPWESWVQWTCRECRQCPPAGRCWRRLLPPWKLELCSMYILAIMLSCFDKAVVWTCRDHLVSEIVDVETSWNWNDILSLYSIKLQGNRHFVTKESSSLPRRNIFWKCFLKLFGAVILYFEISLSFILIFLQFYRLVTQGHPL